MWLRRRNVKSIPVQMTGGLLDAGFETASDICPEQGKFTSFSSPHAQLQLGQCAGYCGGSKVYAKK